MNCSFMMLHCERIPCVSTLKVIAAFQKVMPSVLERKEEKARLEIDKYKRIDTK
jgi:hypothetical protein